MIWIDESKKWTKLHNENASFLLVIGMWQSVIDTDSYMILFLLWLICLFLFVLSFINCVLNSYGGLLLCVCVCVEFYFRNIFHFFLWTVLCGDIRRAINNENSCTFCNENRMKCTHLVHEYIQLTNKYFMYEYIELTLQNVHSSSLRGSNINVSILCCGLILLNWMKWYTFVLKCLFQWT